MPFQKLWEPNVICHLDHPKIKCAFWFHEEQTFICFILLVYFGKAVTFPFSICRQRSLHTRLMENWWRKATHHQVKESTALHVHVSVLLVLCLPRRRFCMIRSMSYFMLHGLKVLQRKQDMWVASLVVLPVRECSYSRQKGKEVILADNSTVRWSTHACSS